MKIKDALNLGGPLEAKILLSFVLRQPKEYLYTHPENNLTYRQEKNFLYRLGRRRQGEPIAYLTGHKEFYGLDFLVDQNTLIPRTETELLVDTIINNETMKQSNTFIDVGTGSGCIAIALAKHLPQAKIIATDISLPALKIAKQNARRHQVEKQIKFIPSSLLTPLKKQLNNETIEQWTIVANLPYLNKRQMSEPSIKFEPTTALYGGPDGLEYFSELFSQIKKLKSLHSTINILLEIDPSQAKKITKLAQEILPDCEMEIKKDLSGRDRVAVINYHGN